MALKIKYKLNKSQRIEHSLLCIKCTGETTHKVMASYDLDGEDGDYYWSVDYQIVQCLGCKSISFREASSNSEDYYEVDFGEYETEIVEKLYPHRIDGIKGLGSEILYLPSTVRRIYEETIQALSSSSPVLAAIGLRALLETICKEKNAKGKDLLNKIDDLVVKGILTPAGAAILHKIRSLGNAAAHEVKPHNNKQLALAIDIIEHLLKDVYIFPKQVETEFGKD